MKKSAKNSTSKKMDKSSKVADKLNVLAQIESNGLNGRGSPVAAPNPKEKSKEKRRNNEKRKEKSRDAARCRRSRETEIFSELATALPLSPEEVEQLDKASVMRLSIAYLRVRGMIDLIPSIKDLSAKDVDTEEMKKENNPFPLPDEMENQKFILQALDGFVLVLSGDGEITFVSENVTDFLGLNQIDLMGQPIWEYGHQCDHDELREALLGRRGNTLQMQKGNIHNDGHPLVHRDFFMRLKCTLTSRGRSVNIKSASYKVIHVSGHMVTSDDGQRQLVSVCRPLPHPSNIEVPMGSSTFLTKHSLDMKFSYVDDKMFSLLGYEPNNLLGKSLYECHHGEDSDQLLAAFKSLINKGQTETCRYRFLARCGGYSWIVTQATLIYDKQKPQSVVCVNYVISGIENKDEIYSCAQLEAFKKIEIKEESVKQSENIACASPSPPATPVLSPTPAPVPTAPPAISIAIPTIQSLACRPQAIFASRARSVTASLFAPAPPVVNDPVTVSIPSLVVTPATSSAAISVTAKSTPINLNNSIPPRPQPVTSTLFVPRTKDMNKGFLMFSEEEPGLTMLKDEPDDLTHLAPTAGDECIPLEETTPFFSDMFDDLILPDNYCSLLPDEINSLDSQGSSHSKGNSVDPFINYRDDLSDTSGSPNMLSPGLSKSPAGSSLPSLCSPNGSLPEEELTFMTMNMEDDLDLSMRAPYISMNETDDLPLLISDDLMWGAFPEGLALHKDIIKTSNNIMNHNSSNNNHNHNTNNNNSQNHMKTETKVIDTSSLAALLCSSGGAVDNGNTVCDNASISQQQMSQHNTQIHIINTQQLQQQQLHHQETIKTNLVDQGGGNCVNPNDILGQVYNKNCTNIETTWAMPELLQINTSTSSNPIKQQCNTLISTSPTFTIIHHQQQQHQQQHQQPQQHQNLHQQSQQHNHLQQSSMKRQPERTINHKRPSNVPTIDSNIIKRAKLSNGLPSSCDVQSSPQLLQQLMAPTPTPHRVRVKTEKNGDGRWTMESGGPNAGGIGGYQQSSNSVLMNLLVSGCDDELSMEPPNFDMDVEMCTDFNLTESNNKTKLGTTIANPDLLLSSSILHHSSGIPKSNPLICGSNISPCSSPKRKLIRGKSAYLDADTITFPLLYDLMEPDYNDVMVNGEDISMVDSDLLNVL